MDSILITGLVVISALTGLTVEAIKKILNEKGIQYSSNLLAVIVAGVLTLAISVCYILYNAIPITVQTVITIIALMFLSFLSSTCGYDKVIQLLRQIWGKE